MNSRYPIVFEEGKGYSPGIAGLMFIPISGGIVVGLVGAPFVNAHYNKLRSQHTGHPPPELRLIPMIWGCWLIPIGVFIVSLYPLLTCYMSFRASGQADTLLLVVCLDFLR